MSNPHTPNLPYDAWNRDVNAEWSAADNWTQGLNFAPATGHVLPESTEIALINPAFPQSDNSSSTPFTVIYDTTVPTADRTIGGLWVIEPKVASGPNKGKPSVTLQIGATGTISPANAVTLTVLGNVSYTYPDGKKRSGNRNGDIIEVTGNGTLVMGGPLVNTGGIVEVLSGGLIDFTGATVTNGVLTIDAGGTVNATGSGETTTLTKVATTDNGTLGATGNATLDLKSTVIGTGQIAANGGTVLIDNATLAGGLILSSSNGGVLETKAGTAASLLKPGSSITAGSTLTISAGSSLTLEGAVTNDGQISIADPVASGGKLLIGGAASLAGTGTVVLDGSLATITDNGTAATLTNATETITGSGTIGTGDGKLTFTNNGKGTVDANGGSITIDAAVANHGSLQTENGGSLTLDGAITNTGGTISANGGKVTATTTTTLDGEIKIGGGGTFDLVSGASDAAATFSAATGSTGTLELGSSGNYTAMSVGNLKGDNSGNNVIDLRSVIFADLSSATESFVQGTGTGSNASGVLTIGDGTHSNSVTLLGQYVAAFTESAPANYSGFILSADSAGGTLVTYTHAVAPPAT